MQTLWVTVLLVGLAALVEANLVPRVVLDPPRNPDKANRLRTLLKLETESNVVPRVMVDPPRNPDKADRLRRLLNLETELLTIDRELKNEILADAKPAPDLAINNEEPKFPNGAAHDSPSDKPASEANHKDLLAPKVVVESAPKKGPRINRWDAHDPGYFTDELARNFMLPLAAASYAVDPSVCLKNKFKNATLSKHVITECESNNGRELCAGYTAVSHSEKAIIIAFRGTDGFLELVTEVRHVVLKKKKDAPIGGKIAYYFHTVFDQLWQHGIKEDVEILLTAFPDYEIWVTGHSLGGSVASIAATWILNEYELENDRIKLITFGQPRTGDTEYALAHNQKLPRTYRVTHKRDLVPHVPPERFEGYYHHESEIWYPSGMKPGDTFIVCNDGESRECSDKQWLDVSISDHLHYYDKYVSAYGVDGCVEGQHL